MAAQLNNPTGVAVDSSGNLFIADQFNHRIRKVDKNGTISTVAGNGSRGFSGNGDSATAVQLNYPSGVAVDSRGNLFIADSSNNRIRKVDAPNVAPLSPSEVTAVAGDSQAQVSWSVPGGNGGSAVTGYTVTSSPSGASCPVAIITGNTQKSCTATGLTNGQSYTFSVVATNAVGDGPAATSNPVTPLATLMLALPANAVNAQLGEVYELAVVANGGAGSYTFALAPNTALPAGLSLNTSTGAITGTPTAAAGSYPVTVQVTDGAGDTASLTINITVVLADVTVPAANQTLPDAVVGTAYNASIVASGGTGGYGFSVSAGQLPAGLTLNSDTGAITGTSTQVESQGFSITIVDSTLKSDRLKAGGTTVHSKTQSFSIAVKAAPLESTTAPTPVPSLGAWAVALLSLAAAALGALGLGWRRMSAKA